MHQTLMGKARAMCLYAKCSENLWDKFYLTATHLHAKVWTHNLKDQTPYELWKGWKPDYLYMHEISCYAFVLIQNHHNLKIFERSIKCVLIGYDLQSKTYRCYDQQRRVVYSSYHVCFIKSHEAPAKHADPLPDRPHVDDKPFTVGRIPQGANSAPILFDREEEEFLLTNLRQPIPNYHLN